MPQDPLAQLGVPATPAANADPLASLGVSAASSSGSSQTPPPSQGVLSTLADTGADVAAGVVKGAGDTVSGVSHLLNKIPGIGETLAPSAGVGALDQLDTSKNTAQSVGKGIEGIAEFAAGDEALEGAAKASKLVALAQKYPLIAKTLDMATAHPWLAKIITEGAKGATVGGAEGTVKGAQKNRPASGAAIGAATGGLTGAAVGSAVGAVDALKSMKVNPFRAILEGKGVAQEPAEAALRQGVQESAQAAGVAPAAQAGIAANPVLAGNETVLDEPLQLIASKEKKAYQAVDKTVGFDLKEAKLGLKNDQYNLQQLGNTPADQAARKTLTESINDSTSRINQAESKLKAAGIDPKAADQIHTARMAGEDFKKAIVRTTAPDGTINVDQLLKQSKTLRFTKRGDRLAQFMGPKAADAYMQELQAAQEAGVHAMKVQKIAKWVGGLAASGLGLGAGAEVASHLFPPTP